MKTIIKSSLVCCTLLIMSANCYSQNNLGNNKNFNSFMGREYVDNSGLHLEFDAGYAPFAFWSVSDVLTTTTEVLVTDKNTSEVTKSVSTKTEARELKANYTVGANLALVYQWKSDIYLGGGTGVRMQELSWEGEGKPYSKNWGIPIYLRAGITEGFQGIKKVSMYANADIGLLIGTGDLKTSIFTDIQAGIYYGTTKIGLGFMSTKPNPDSYFDYEIAKGLNLAFGLFMGFRIF
jgi:hypothetical protein